MKLRFMKCYEHMKNKDKLRLEIFRWKGIVYHQKYKNEIFFSRQIRI